MLDNIKPKRTIKRLWKAKTRPERKKVDTVAASPNRGFSTAVEPRAVDALKGELGAITGPMVLNSNARTDIAAFAELKAENEKLRKLVVELALQVVAK